MDLEKILQQAAEEDGFIVHWAPISLPYEVKTRYRQWTAAGHHATMGQLARAQEVRLEPTRRLSWVQSTMILSAPHAFPDPGVPEDGIRIGRVGRIFWFHEQDLSVCVSNRTWKTSKLSAINWGGVVAIMWIKDLSLFAVMRFSRGWAGLDATACS